MALPPLQLDSPTPSEWPKPLLLTKRNDSLVSTVFFPRNSNWSTLISFCSSSPFPQDLVGHSQHPLVPSEISTIQSSPPCLVPWLQNMAQGQRVNNLSASGIDLWTLEALSTSLPLGQAHPHLIRSELHPCFPIPLRIISVQRDLSLFP